MEPSLTEILSHGANDVWHLGLTDQQLAQFARYADILVEWNATRFNLTRLTSPRDIAVKHFLDSLAPLTFVSIPRGAAVLDVGTGAGLPGLAWKILRPDIKLTLLDSTAKKLAFCRAAADDLHLDDVETVHARAEDVGRSAEHGGAYDIVVARAVAPLPILLPWLVSFLRPMGIFVALKGVAISDELAAVRLAAQRMGVIIDRPAAVELPGADAPTVRQILIGRRIVRRS